MATTKKPARPRKPAAKKGPTIKLTRQLAEQAFEFQDPISEATWAVQSTEARFCNLACANMQGGMMFLDFYLLRSSRPPSRWWRCSCSRIPR
jgi:hypothetical protein